MDGSNITNEVIARKVNEEIAARADQPGGPGFSLFTGDASEGAGGERFQTGGRVDTPLDRNQKHRNWVDVVAGPLAEIAGPVFGAIGGEDLEGVQTINSGQALDPVPSNQRTPRPPAPTTSGATQWPTSPPGSKRRQTAPTPTYQAPPASPSSASRTCPPPSRSKTRRSPASSLTKTRPSTPPSDTTVKPGAPTHYAEDVYRNGNPNPIARIVVADTSQGSLTASDPQGAPQEAGGQAAWLQQVLCTGQNPGDTGCTRKPDQKAIVLSNTPTYTYAPISPTETQTDAAAFESIMLKNKVSVVVSGRLGWNGEYWTRAPGVHYPAPGGNATALPAPVQGAIDTATGANTNLQGALTTVVSSSAGGKFNAGAEQAGQATAANGFWRGYSVVHVAPDGSVTVEQRPVLDWIGVRGDKRVLRAGQKTTIVGYGREPFGIDQSERFYDIPTTPAVTHCWDLVLADPGKPWMPLEAKDATKEQLAGAQGQGCKARSFAVVSAGGGPGTQETGDACAPYVCASSSVGSIDGQSGEVTAVGGVSSRTYALAILSVGAHVATYPLVFEPRPGFNAELVPSSPPPLAASSPPAPPPPPSSSGGFTLPPTPALPAIPPLASQPPLAPPAPPLPPNSSAANLTLFTSPPVLSVAPSVSLFPPSAPVINVAPPTPARPIEKARKVAVQSSGSDTDAKSPSAWRSAAT